MNRAWGAPLTALSLSAIVPAESSIVDHLGHLLLVRVSLLERLLGRSPFGFRLVDGLQAHPPAPFVDELVDLHGMTVLLSGLHLHPAGESAQVEGLEIGGHGEVEILRVQLRVDLPVESRFHLLLNFHVFLLSCVCSCVCVPLWRFRV